MVVRGVGVRMQTHCVPKLAAAGFKIPLSQPPSERAIQYAHRLHVHRPRPRRGVKCHLEGNTNGQKPAASPRDDASSQGQPTPAASNDPADPPLVAFFKRVLGVFGVQVGRPVNGTSEESAERSSPAENVAQESNSATNGTGKATPSSTDEAGSPAADGEEATAARVVARVHTQISEIAKDEWNACALAQDETNPFVAWEFLAALEDSKSAVREKGWLPQHVSLRDSQGKLLGVCPMYLKGHSYGEYVFDHSWASLYARLGKPYYPKLQSCVPFTPVTGPRILVAPDCDGALVRRTIMQTLVQLADTMKVSSLHMTFNTQTEWGEMGSSGWMKRIGLQYHWENPGYSSFEDFLADLKQSKRKCIRQERKSIAKQGLAVERLRGSQITEEMWHAFYEFYLDTVDRKWGSAYLTRDFFVRLGATMGDNVLLVVARDTNLDNEVVAAALNLVGSHALFGRNWGCKYADKYKNLHFELCYYQAIEAAIEMGLPRVEAGAQGEHKVQRGYLPNLTYSCHYVRDPVARSLINQFLRRETVEMSYTINTITHLASPFKNPGLLESGAFSAIRAVTDSEQASAAREGNGGSARGSDAEESASQGGGVVVGAEAQGVSANQAT